MDRVLIDDVTLRSLRAVHADVDAWLRSLKMVGWEPEPAGRVTRISNGTINGFLREPAVYDTHVTLGEGVTFTRGGAQPGPQLVVTDVRLPDSVRAALTGQPARRLVDHAALADTRIVNAFHTSGHLHVDLDVPMTSVATSIPIADIKARMEEKWSRARLT